MLTPLPNQSMSTCLRVEVMLTVCDVCVTAAALLKHTTIAKSVAEIFTIHWETLQRTSPDDIFPQQI